MESIIQFLIGPFLEFSSEVFVGTILLLSLVLYWFRDQFNLRFVAVVGVGALIVFKIAYAGIATWAQYYIWSLDGFSQLLLPPHQSWGYFTFYAWSRFWLQLVISLCISFLFYFFLRGLKRYKKRFLEKGEIEFGLLTALAAGWPGFLVFIPVAFIAVILLSIIRRLFTNNIYTTLGFPFIIAAITAFYMQEYLIDILNLGVFS